MFHRLKINIEGCVNTLRDECDSFYAVLGRDGRNQTSPARFPCHYAPHNPEFVVLTFDLPRTKRLFLFFFVVPASLLVLSCGSLFLCSRVLTIDNAGRMRFDCCDDASDEIFGLKERENEEGDEDVEEEEEERMRQRRQRS